MNKIVLGCLLLFVASTATIVNAEPTSAPAYIVSIRPYQGQLSTNTSSNASVFIQVDIPVLCNTDTFRLEMKLMDPKR